MCGIAGIVALDGFDPRTLIAMTQMIAYRGPSGYGFAYSLPGPASSMEVHHNDEQLPAVARPVLGLGNRRLAILDLSPSGNQPMQSDDGSLCVTYNGEIYNYKEIRLELERLGHRFHSATDTEVLLRSYQQWGEECLDRFNGMLSFALWDRSAQKLFCARDRFGVKPFYFSLADRTFVFGSEIKQVLAALGKKRVANPRVLSDFLEWGLQDHLEETSFEGVSQLLGGHSLSLHLREPLRPAIRCYWELKVEPELQVTREDAVDEFRSRFAEAVKLRLRSDVPVGVSLSGGVDSSAILCEAKRLSPASTFQTFSACFEDSRFDERSYISTVTTVTNSARRWTFPDSESFWKNLETIVYHQDEPVGGTSVFAQWNVMQEARNHGVPVMLGGQGGDEALCGYRKYYFFYLWHLLRKADPRFLRETVLFAQSGTSSYWTVGTASRYLPALFRNRVSALRRLATPALRNVSRNSQQWIGAGANIAERQKSDLLKISLPKLLRHEDRNSMAHSVESRLPFLDYRLVELAVRCPDSFKLHDGWSKWLLREAVAGTLPDEIRLRKSKLGFTTPEAEWLHKGLRNGHRHLWHSEEVRMDKYLDAKSLALECARFLEGGAGSLPAEMLFRALSIEMWARVHQVS
ncbi:MAG: asparagine synthase (glutamine-hydrolyzing) [Acidobacteriia bacterium]|nr:asparagine synthase (glutamine-hydrolyzing) [Terriglobia bacterium]